MECQPIYTRSKKRSMKNKATATVRGAPWKIFNSHNNNNTKNHNNNMINKWNENKKTSKDPETAFNPYVYTFCPNLAAHLNLLVDHQSSLMPQRSHRSLLSMTLPAMIMFMMMMMTMLVITMLLLYWSLVNVFGFFCVYKQYVSRLGTNTQGWQVDMK